MSDGVVIIGYGNVLRGDDGVGWHVAEILSEDPALAGAEILARHQLTPEMAEDVGRASLVIFIDAAAGPAAGSLAISRVEVAGQAATTWSHHLDPEALVGLAAALYGPPPAAYLVTVGAGSLEPGETLSPAVLEALPRVAAAVAGICAGHAPAGGELALLASVAPAFPAAEPADA